MSESRSPRSSPLRAPKGVAEYVGGEAREFRAVRDALLDQADLAGYTAAELPIFEDTALYIRGVGESTDVVSKEMFTFADRAGRSLTLRPEGTAGAIRSIIENGLDRGALPVKLSYAGPFFRAERPQAGRYRQFAQVGIEAVGSADPALDAEVIAVADAGFRSLGLRQFSLLLNSLGCASCRADYRTALVAYLDTLDLDDATRARARTNPLRVLDDKRPQLADAIAAAPVAVDYLCAECRAHYDAVRTFLAALGIAWTEAPRLVRGLDYYTRTTFEFSHALLGAQSGIGGGGRYDGLVASLGGRDIPGIGFGLGVDRTLLACRAEGVAIVGHGVVEAYAVPLGEEGTEAVLPIVASLRSHGIACDLSLGGRGLRGALRSADALGARWAVIVGARDLAERSATLRDMTTGDQQSIPLDRVVDAVRAARTATDSSDIDSGGLS